MPSGPKKRRAARRKKELVEKYKDVIGISSSSDAGEKDGSLGGKVATVVLSEPEYEPEKGTFRVDVKGKGIKAVVDFDPKVSKENEKTPESEPSLSTKEDLTMLSAKEYMMVLAEDYKEFGTKVQDSDAKTEVESPEAIAADVYAEVQENVDEVEKESDVFVLPSGDEYSKKSINDAAKMTQNIDRQTEGLVHDDSKMPEDNAALLLKENEENMVLIVDEKTSESSDFKVMDEIFPSIQNVAQEVIEGSILKENSDKQNLGLKDGSNTGGDDIVICGNDSVVDSTVADEIGLKETSFAIPSDGSCLTPKQDDCISLPVLVAGVETAADEKNKFESAQIQSDKESLNSAEAASQTIDQKMLDDLKADHQSEALQATESTTSNDEAHQTTPLVEVDDQGEALQAAESTISSDELHQTTPLVEADNRTEVLQATESTTSNDEVHQKTTLQVSISGCILSELIGGSVSRERKILKSSGEQINLVKKMVEEELLATDKLRATLKKLLDDLEAVQNSSDSGFSA